MRLGFNFMSQRIKLSRQWVGPGSPRPKKFKMQPSAGKVMATVFWDAKGVIMLDFLPKRSTRTGVYYANLLDQLRIAIREKRRGKLSKGVLLQQDNPRVHTCKVAMDAVERNGYELRGSCKKFCHWVRITSVLRFIKHIFITNLQSIPPLLKHIFVTFLLSLESVGDTDK